MAVKNIKFLKHLTRFFCGNFVVTEVNNLLMKNNRSPNYKRFYFKNKKTSFIDFINATVENIFRTIQLKIIL